MNGVDGFAALCVYVRDGENPSPKRKANQSCFVLQRLILCVRSGFVKVAKYIRIII